MNPGETSSFIPDPVTAPFWEGTRRHELRVQRCHGCQSWQQLAQAACAQCLADVRWERVSGSGTVYSFSIVSRPAMPDIKVPYVVAIIALEEGPRILSTLIDVEPDAISIGMPVEVRFVDLPDRTIYPFAPGPVPASKEGA